MTPGYTFEGLPTHLLQELSHKRQMCKYIYMLQKPHSLSTGNIPITNNRLYSEQNKKPVSNCAFVLGELELILYPFLCRSDNFLQCKKIGSIQQNK